MASAEYDRRQAALLNELASSTPDPETASLMRQLAAEYIDEAAATDRTPHTVAASAA
jgi:hypothetical protein